MKTQLSFANLAGIETELLAVLATDTQTAKGPDAKPQPVLLTTDEAVKAAAAIVLSSGEYKAGANETLLLHAPAGLAAKRLLIVGLGKQAKTTVHSVRNAAGTAVRYHQAPRHSRAGAGSPLVRDFCLPLAQRSAPRSKALSSATSIPIPIAATARIRAFSPSPSQPLPTPTSQPCKPHLPRASSSAKARTSPALSSTSPATSSPPPSLASAPLPDGR